MEDEMSDDEIVKDLAELAVTHPQFEALMSATIKLIEELNAEIADLEHRLDGAWEASMGEDL
jgi:hypothetical protein